MENLKSKTITGAKYVYLGIFFAFLSGFFHPLITNQSGDAVIIGALVLFVGLAGGVLVYKASTGEKRKMIYLGAGFGLIALSLMFISQLTGRF